MITSGCNLSNKDSPSFLKTNQIPGIQKYETNYLIDGRIKFKNKDVSYSGEMTIQMFNNSDFKLDVFTPLVGTTLYTISANSKNFLLINFQEKYYIKENNNAEVRHKWLGMDLTQIELKWLILGKIPLGNNTWIVHKLSKNKYRILKGSTELIFHLNSMGHIENMEKFKNGLLEYNAEIKIYKKYVNKYFPRKIIIEDYSKKNHWKIIISNIQTQSRNIKALDFNPPKYLKEFTENQ